MNCLHADHDPSRTFERCSSVRPRVQVTLGARPTRGAHYEGEARRQHRETRTGRYRG